MRRIISRIGAFASRGRAGCAMLRGMRLPALALLGLVAALAGACQSPPPVEEKPKRRSFAEDSQWQPPAAPARTDPATSIDAQAQQVNDKWEQVRQTSDEAERQRLANEALRDTRAMADQPSGQ
jgi:hypothetical protein